MRDFGEDSKGLETLDHKIQTPRRASNENLRPRDKKNVCRTLFWACSRAAMNTTRLRRASIPAWVALSFLRALPAVAADQNESTPSPDGSRQVLEEVIPRMSIEPIDLPFSLCFHPTKKNQASSAMEPPPGLSCVEETGALNLDFPVAPASFITMTLPRLADVRVRLFDESHRLVPSRDRLSADALQTHYLLVPETPLISGTKYFLRVDGLVDSLPAAADGTTYRNTRISFMTSGEKPPLSSPPKTKQSKSKKKKDLKKNRKQRH